MICRYDVGASQIVALSYKICQHFPHPARANPAGARIADVMLAALLLRPLAVPLLTVGPA
jgi:hypothetical protein